LDLKANLPKGLPITVGERDAMEADAMVDAGKLQIPSVLLNALFQKLKKPLGSRKRLLDLVVGLHETPGPRIDGNETSNQGGHLPRLDEVGIVGDPKCTPKKKKGEEKEVDGKHDGLPSGLGSGNPKGTPEEGAVDALKRLHFGRLELEGFDDANAPKHLRHRLGGIGKRKEGFAAAAADLAPRTTQEGKGKENPKKEEGGKKRMDPKSSSNGSGNVERLQENPTEKETHGKISSLKIVRQTREKIPKTPLRKETEGELEEVGTKIAA